MILACCERHAYCTIRSQYGEVKQERENGSRAEEAIMIRNLFARTIMQTTIVAGVQKEVFFRLDGFTLHTSARPSFYPMMLQPIQVKKWI